ncbi:HPF/RaiA family ribosome-associated protein [Salinimicrobium sp. WS361]|jgi:putative sigma-54 modulation protein|uniref:HPF/RaiA family ribosome-associated protein n=1 Tax=Salinimicrobium sp. WS361 TaxID=3425123 RepID=UPI003D6EFA5D
MKTNIQFVHADTKLSAEQLVQRKLDKLENKYDWIISADVMFREEKSTNGNGKTCAIELSLPGPKIHASSNSDSFEAAAAETVKDLEKQLQKRKAEMQSH